MALGLVGADRPTINPDLGIGVDPAKRGALLDAAAEVPDAAVTGLLDSAGVDADTVEIAKDPAFDRIRDGSHLLMRGHTGDTVTAAQERLIELGIMNPESDPLQQADGIFGGQTEAAVRRFQEQRGLKVDGIIGQETIGALDTAAAERAARRPDIPTTLEEREEARTEIVTDIADSLGVVEAPAEDVGVTVGEPDAAPERAEAPALPSIDPDKAASADVALPELREAIRPGDPNVEPAVLKAVGGEVGLAAGIDAVLDSTLLPERYDDALGLVEEELVTPDPAADTPVDPARIEDFRGSFRMIESLARTAFMGADPATKGDLNTLLVNASDAELDALYAADPQLVNNTIAALGVHDPEYAATVGRYFGIER